MAGSGLLLRLSALAVLLLCFKDVAAQTKKILLKVSLGDGPSGDFLGESDVYDMESEGYTKQTSKNPIQGTTQPELFQKQRFSRGQDLMLRVPVPDGVYSLTLLMAEVYEPACAPGARVFDIALGTPHSGVSTVAKDFDLFGNAGCATAYGKRFDGVVSKDGIVIRLGHKKQHPTLAGYIVEGHPVPKGDGSEYKAIEQAPEEGDATMGAAGAGGVAGLGDTPAVTGRMGEAPSESESEPTPLTTGDISVTGAQAAFESASLAITPPGAPDPQASNIDMSMVQGEVQMQPPSRRRLLNNRRTERRKGRRAQKRSILRRASLETPSRLSLVQPIRRGA